MKKIYKPLRDEKDKIYISIILIVIFIQIAGIVYISTNYITGVEQNKFCRHNARN